jgi:hypothetical protein
VERAGDPRYAVEPLESTRGHEPEAGSVYDHPVGRDEQRDVRLENWEATADGLGAHSGGTGEARRPGDRNEEKEGEKWLKPP